MSWPVICDFNKLEKSLAAYEYALSSLDHASSKHNDRNAIFEFDLLFAMMNFYMSGFISAK